MRSGIEHTRRITGIPQPPTALRVMNKPHQRVTFHRAVRATTQHHRFMCETIASIERVANNSSARHRECVLPPKRVRRYSTRTASLRQPSLCSRTISISAGTLSDGESLTNHDAQTLVSFLNQYRRYAEDRQGRCL